MLDLQLKDLQMFKDLPGQCGQHGVPGQVSERDKETHTVYFASVTTTTAPSTTVRYTTNLITTCKFVEINKEKNVWLKRKLLQTWIN